MPADPPRPEPAVKTRCCIVGGGPAGMMLGLLLARAGIEVTVLEKHADFLRDFRGDTIHPSTLEVMHELGLLEGLLQRPHQKLGEFFARFGDITVPIADFRHLPTRCRFVAMMPQWDFLDFLARAAAGYPGFSLRMEAEAVDLIGDSAAIQGVRAMTPAGMLEMRADLVVAADGRHSAIRKRAGLQVEEIGAPMDVLWFALSRLPGDPDQTSAKFGPGRVLVMINRGTYWQCGFVIPKGSADALRADGLPAFRDGIARLAPFAADRASELRGWDDVKLLTVAVDRLTEWWRPGLLCIGDAAHAMSPMGGVGINLAIQDAVAAANILAAPLRAGRPQDADLRAVQRRREPPTRLTQRLQVLFQDRMIRPVLGSTDAVSVPWPLRLLATVPWLRRLPARFMGLGFRPEHVRTPERA